MGRSSEAWSNLTLPDDLLSQNRRLQEERLGGYARIAVHGFTAGHDFQHTIRQRSLQLAGFIPRCR
jgi:hypothetical protein